MRQFNKVRPMVKQTTLTSPDEVVPTVPDWSIPREELDRLIREHHGTKDDVLMTPVMAAYILNTYNTGNRKLRNRHANNFAKTIKRGGWENTGEPIIFAKEGILNSGQHRLEGVVRSRTPAVMDVRFGIPRRAFANTDTGAKRLAGDVLSIVGSTSPYAAAAAVKLLLAYEAGLPGGYAQTMDNDEILLGFERWPDIEDAVDVTHKMIARRGFLNASSNAFTFLALRQTDAKITKEFLGLVESGLTKARNDAPRLLRERLLIDEKLARGSRPAVIERLALFIKAWNYWRLNERPKKLTWMPNETFPVMKGVKL